MSWVRTPSPALMLENLKLPLCPKCGDTKNVKDKNDYSQCVMHGPNYECLTCDISWTPNTIVDNKTNVKHIWDYPRGGVLGGNNLRWFNPLKWWRTLTEDIKSERKYYWSHELETKNET